MLKGCEVKSFEVLSFLRCGRGWPETVFVNVVVVVPGPCAGAVVVVVCVLRATSLFMF